MNMAEKRQKRPTEAIDGLYSAIPILVLDSVAFKGAGHTSKALLFEVMRQHNGANNGHMQLSFSWLNKRGWKSRDVIQRARDELINRNLIIQTKQGGLNMGASKFAVTWLRITNFVGLDIQAKNYHRGAWAFMNELPPTKNLISLSRETLQAVPENGIAQS